MLEWFIPPVLFGAAALVPNKRLANWELTNKHLYHHSWIIPIGKKRNVMYHNFEHYPHLLVGGTTRFGKTVFLKSTFVSILMTNPDRVRFIILDLKGGLEFWKYRNLPQVLTVAPDLLEAAKALDHVYKLIKLDEERFRKNGWSNITDTPLKERTFIIVDEGAELSPKLVSKDFKKYAELCQVYLGEIARIGGGLGYRLIYATQYPTAEAVPQQVKMNMVARLAFRIADNIGSRVILGETGAEELEPVPGRAIYKLAEKHKIQCPYISDKTIGGYLNELGKDRTDITSN
ncbi:FtsK/SpoIIIE domain-containing protein [Neobacillus massiliamazoniensis]|uniref:Prophage LambdaBa02, FtsK/SpoIIIE family protein n=1 Tax=Neobacillus massiliamazoniensis TaxID=1499688 RepID=A0A0U1NQG9_9BACI|nr:FtsK/SpoIIIE domain-containing protein [Neobacillus massiliamazoniensis]CRK80284.1 prophage LambdaBa02, FtsK/SpoIIIE family protein [Neobacillus massiliamazoniensis]